MNKLFIVLLAVCLFSVVSAHAFVKRDTPPADDLTTHVNAIKEQITKLGTDLGEQIAAAVNPDVLKKNVNDAIDMATKTLEKFKPAPAAAEGATPAPAT